MAEAESGPGRMAEPLEIVAAAEALLGGRRRPCRSSGTAPAAAGKRVLVTSGPTHEPIDPVRYIANRSSGKQGHAIARGRGGGRRQGHARVRPGRASPTRPASRPSMSRPRARCSTPSRRRCRPTSPSSPPRSPIGGSPRRPHEKIKKEPAAAPALALTENPDILATVARRDRRPARLVVGFAAETENVVEHARAKLARKGCDLIVANDVSPRARRHGRRATTPCISSPRTGVETWPTLDKDEVARRLVAGLADMAREASAP